MTKPVAVIPDAVMARIRDRAEEAYPEECCGYLTGFAERRAESDAGSAGAGSTGAAAENGRAGALTVRILEEIPARNAAAEQDRRREFLVEPKDLLDVMKTYRDRAQDVVGFYHSHPDHEAELSPTDLRFARLWPRTVWLVAPVAAGHAGRERAWWLAAGEPEPEKVKEIDVQEMIIRSSGADGEAAAPREGRAITPREERA